MTAPNGCAICGKPKKTHSIEAGPHGFHVWQAPTDEQRKQRMLDNRSEKE